MKVRRDDKDPTAIVFAEIEPFLQEMLHELPADSDPGDHSAAEGRLFGDPVDDPAEGDDFNQDWRDFIQPEIRSLFRTARQIVSADLEDLPASEMPAVDATGTMVEFNAQAFVPGPHHLVIPEKHSEAWLSVLNQARLVIAARRNFEEAAMDEELSFPPISPRDRDLFKIHFYDDMQQLLMRELGFG